MAFAIDFREVYHEKKEELQRLLLSAFLQPMQKTSLQGKIHLKNINLHKASTISGAIGQQHSRLIDQLAAQVENRHKETLKVEVGREQLSEKEKVLLKRIEDLDREQSSLKREMIRISEMAKSYKISKAEIEIKNQNLLQEYTICKRQNEELKVKMDLLGQLNATLVKIAQNSIKVLPSCTSGCNQLLQSIEKVKTQVAESSTSSAVFQLRKKLDIFKAQADNAQTFSKKLLTGLAEAQQQTKTISERLSLLSELALDEIAIKRELSQIEESAPSESTISEPQEGGRLGLYCRIGELTVIPAETSRMNRILQEICLLFEQHIHLLETQKMEYQFTKNKKLITAQKYECDICESYEKIVSQIFSIVREAFKEIKFQFLRQIKQVDNIQDIPFLI